MHRRTYLASLVGGGILGVAGCLGGADPAENGTENEGESTNSSPNIDGDNPILTLGEQDTIPVQVDNVGVVQFSSLPESDTVSIDVGEAEFSESTSGGYDSEPPHWTWYPPNTSVEIYVPVSAATDAETGKHHYAVTAWHAEQNPDKSLNDANSVTEEFTITVTEE